MNMPIATRAVGREATASDIRAVREFVKTHGGLKRVALNVQAMSDLLGVPPEFGFDGSRYVDLLKANFKQVGDLIEYANSHGGLKRLQAEIGLVMELATLTGGSLEKARQAIDFLSEK